MIRGAFRESICQQKSGPGTLLARIGRLGWRGIFEPAQERAPGTSRLLKTLRCRCRCAHRPAQRAILRRVSGSPPVLGSWPAIKSNQIKRRNAEYAESRGSRSKTLRSSAFSASLRSFGFSSARFLSVSICGLKPLSDFGFKQGRLIVAIKSLATRGLGAVWA